MFNFLPTSVALFAALSLTVVADDAGTFEERVHRFTGGEYKDEEFRYMVLNPPQIEPKKSIRWSTLCTVLENAAAIQRNCCDTFQSR